MRIILVSAALIALTAASHAQQLRSQNTIPRAAVRAVVFEFESPEDPALGSAIARRMAIDMSARIPGIRGILVHHPLQETERVSFNPDAVVEKAKSEGAMLMMWGEYYLTGDTITVISRVRLVPVHPMTESDYGFVYQTQHGDFLTHLPAMQVSFAPVMFTRAELEAGTPATGFAVRSAASDEAAQIGTLAARQDLDIIAVENGWARIRWQGTGAGWIRLQGGEMKSDPRSAAPALYSAGFASFSTGDYITADSSLATYTHVYAKEQDAMNAANAHTLLGTSRVRALGATKSLPANENATPEFEKAVEINPDHAPAEYLAVARMMKYEGSPDAVLRSSMAASERDLIRSVVDESDTVSVNNMRVFYKLADEKRFLKDATVTDAQYAKQLDNQLDRVEDVKQYVIVVVRKRVRSNNLGSLRIGIRTPKDKEMDFVYKKERYPAKDFSIAQSDMMGLDLQSRHRLFPTTYFDVSIGGWYSSYTMERKPDSRPDTLSLQKAEVLIVLAPVILGVTYAPIQDFPVRPFFTAGGGVTIGLSNRDVTFLDKTSTNEALFIFAPTWQVGAGVDLFVSSGFALSFAARLQGAMFREPLHSGQKNVSGLLLSGGLTFVP